MLGKTEVGFHSLIMQSVGLHAGRKRLALEDARFRAVRWLATHTCILLEMQVNAVA